MPLRLVRSPSNHTLWSACAERFLDELGAAAGPDAFPAWLWVANRNQRDALYRRAVARGLPGWLGPPVSFFSQLPELFGLEGEPIGLLTARLLVARLATERGHRLGIGGSTPLHGAPARTHVLDAVFGELLPEGVAPEELEEALDGLGGDGFARDRNAWIAATYAAFLEALPEGRYDPRSVHGRVAARVEAGELPGALSGAARLHIYGVTSLRSRRRLFRALAEQGEVAVSVYLPLEEEPSEWEETLPVEEVEVLSGEEGEARVQPVPDALREAAWVTRQVKRLLVEERVEPDRIAVVARSGREDTRRIHRAFEAAGIAATARLRTILAEVPALRALLLPFAGEADGWGYRALRNVATSPYLGIRIDTRILDFLAARERIEGLEGWAAAVEELDGLAAGERAGRLRRAGVYADRLEEAGEAIASLRERVAPLREARRERAWIRHTLDLLAGEAFDLRRRLCRAAGERWDVVRLDQRGVRTLEALLREWEDLVQSERPLEVAEWHDRLRRLLEANEIALSTPLQTGVQVLEAHEAALTPFEHVFVVHANDGVFPRPPSGVGAFSEAERRRLHGAGLPLAQREDALRRERTLWRAVVQAPRVTVTYRSTDARGVPLLPSLMVPEHDPAAELPRTLDLASAERVPPPAGPEGHLRREVLELARLRRGGDARPFPTSEPDRLRHAVLGAYAEELRAREPACLRPHAWNGRLRDPWVRAWLERRFDEAYVWSAGQLQTYTTRPFDFLLERVLDLREVEEAEEETTPLQFGSLVHAILERFYAALLGRDGGRLPTGLDGETEALLERVTEEVLRGAEEEAGRWLGLPSLWAIRRREIAEAVRRFLAEELPRLTRWGERPVALELAFGVRDGEEGPPPVLLEGRDVRGRPARLRLRGRIDRLDRMDAGSGDGGLKVIDYKSGGYPTNYDDGALLQTGLYMKATELLGRGAPEVAVFRSITRPGWNGGKLGRDELEDVLAFALSVPARVRSGLFEAVQAASKDRISPWQPGREVTRSEARLREGHRFETDGPSEGRDSEAAAGG